MVRTECTLYCRKCLNEGLKAVAAAELNRVQQCRQHPSIMARTLTFHNILSQQPKMRPAGPEFRDEIPERLLFDCGEDNLAHNTVRLFHNRLCNAGEDLHFAFNTRDIGE